MERKIEEFLLKWKKDIIRKPLLLYGPKQVGKTFTVLKYGKKEYKNMIYINTENNKEISELFKKEKSTDKIILKLSLIFLLSSINFTFYYICGRTQGSPLRFFIFCREMNEIRRLYVNTQLQQ